MAEKCRSLENDLVEKITGSIANNVMPYQHSSFIFPLILNFNVQGFKFKLVVVNTAEREFSNDSKFSIKINPVREYG